MSFVPVVEEPLRVGNVADLSADDLGLRPGVTTFEQARSLLGARGMTGIVEDVFADAAGTTTSVLGADYQTRVHLFSDGRYDRTLTLPTHGLPPYGMALRLGVDGSAHVLLVLYRDPLARDAEPPTLMTFRLREHDIELASRTTFETITEENGGMTQPMLLGTDLGEGVMLVARDRSGTIWDKSYLLRTEGNQLTVSGQPMMNALRCNCVRRYAMGDAAH